MDKLTGHYLRHNAKSTIPKFQIYFDTETDFKEGKNETIHTFKMLCYEFCQWDNNNGLNVIESGSFFNPKLFFNYVQDITKQVSKLVLFAHNLWFDLVISQFYIFAQSDGWKSDIPFQKGITFIDRVKKDKLKINLLNVANFLPYKVELLGKLVGYPKINIDFNTISFDKLITYCKRDVKIIRKAMEKYFTFIRSNRLGNFGVTRSSQSFAAFKHRFMKHKILIHAIGQDMDAEREAYFGGRVECFFKGKVKEKKVYSLDINSMYPFVMSRYTYPIRFSYFIYRPTLVEIKRALAKYNIILKAVINTKTPRYALKTKQRLIFPVGEFITSVCSNGARIALLLNEIDTPLVMYCYQRGKIFDLYVKFFHDLKVKYTQEGNDIFKTMSKDFLNHLYGKFGQRNDEVINEGESTVIGSQKILHYDVVTGERTTQIDFCGKYKEIRLNAKEAFESFPAISAHVTENARLYLFKLITMAGQKNVYYCDTDSLYVNKTGYNKLRSMIDPTQLGMLKLEKIIKSMTINGCKDYVIDDAVTIKGIRKTAEKLDENTYVQDIWSSYRETMSKGLKPYYTVKKGVKILTREYKKGKITDSGRITPFCLPEDDDLI